MDIILYGHFHKRENSLLYPDSNDTDHITITGYLKEPTSIVYPVIKFKRENFHRSAYVHSPHIYTYAYIEDFQRYYYVKDWVWQDGVWEAHMRVDVLASYSEDISGTTAYIERTSALAYVNGNIIDSVYPAITGLTTEIVRFTPLWKKLGVHRDDTFFIMGVVGQYANNGVNYYMLSPTQMSDFITYLMSDDVYTNMGFGGTGEPLSVLSAKALYNPIQYITSCFYFPVDRADVPGKVGPQNMYIGPYDVGSQPGEIRAYQGYKVAGGFGVGSDWSQTITISLPPVHPQAPDRGAFLQYQPYTKYMLVFPPFGNIPIDPSFFAIGDDIKMDVYFDGVTGKGRLVVSRHWYNSLTASYEDFVISEHSAMLGVPIQMNQVSVDYLKASIATVDTASGITGAITSLLTGNMGGFSNGLSNIAHSMGDAITSQSPQLLTEGTNGSAIGMFGDCYLEAKYTPVADDDLADIGRPSLKKQMIAVVGNSGGDGTFIKCADVHVDFKCLDEERNLITKYLLGGFFYE